MTKTFSDNNLKKGWDSSHYKYKHRILTDTTFTSVAPLIVYDV